MPLPEMQHSPLLLLHPLCVRFGALNCTVLGRALVSCVTPGLRLNYRELSLSQE